MPRNVEPLESFRLGRYQLPISCQFCGHDNLFNAERCRECTAPMSLTRSLMTNRSKQSSRPKMFATFGAEGSGKTVYMGMLLDILSRQREQMDFTSCDSSSVAIQQETVASLARGEFPAPTSRQCDDWRWAHCRISRRARKTPYEIFMTDLSGQSLFDELERPGQHELIKGLFAKADAVMVCVDANRVFCGDKEEEFFAMRILNHLAQYREFQTEESSKKSRRKRQNEELPPIAMILTKADECETALGDVHEFSRGMLSNLWELTQSMDNEIEYFAVSAVGRCAIRRFANGRRMHVPLRVEPKGIIEPFRWLLGRNYPQ